MHPCGFIVSNKATTPIQDVWGEKGGRGDMSLLYFLIHFSVNLELLHKSNTCKDKEKKNQGPCIIVTRPPFLCPVSRFFPTITKSTFGDMLLWVKCCLPSIFTKVCLFPLYSFFPLLY